MPGHTPTHPHRRQLLQALALGLCAGALHRVMAQQAPSGRVILTVAGNVAKPNVGREAWLDRSMLMALPQRSLRVATPWYPRPVVFGGPLLRDVLAAVGAGGAQIRAVAINDYAVEIPMRDTTDYDVMLALLRNGKPMSPRDKGPLFVVYPYQQLPQSDLALYQSRSIWQLDRLEIR